jgi:prophage antirepressor-like protein
MLNLNMLQMRSFHVSTPFAINVNHKLFPKVDWERVASGEYAVVDPGNPGSILYLSEQDYIILVRVAITSNRTIKVLAGPSDKEPSNDSTQSPSQNSPHPKPTSPWGDLLNLGSKQTSQGRRGRRRLLNLFNTRLESFLSKHKVSQSTSFGSKAVSMVGLTVGNTCKWFTSWHDTVSWWSRGSSMSTVQAVEANSFGLRLSRVLKNNGVNHLISRLKIMLFTVNAFLGGRKLKSTADLGYRIRLTNGLPQMLPLFVRNGIRMGSKHYIHIWTSMLFSYKGILGTWKEPDLASGSISQPHPDFSENPTLPSFKDFGGLLWEQMFSLKLAKKPDFKIKQYFFSTHAGPNAPITILGAGLDAYLWFSIDSIDKLTTSMIPGEVWGRLNSIRSLLGVKTNYIREWLEATNQKDVLLDIRKTAKMFAINQKLATAVLTSNKDSVYSYLMRSRFLTKSAKKFVAQVMGNLDPKLRAQTQMLPASYFKTREEHFGYEYIYNFFGLNLKDLRFKNPTLQRLHNLYEAAGKVRTIAIVDYWTNFVLKPVHDWMFGILKLFPQDATFDQEGRVQEFAKRGYGEIWSYDLKSATDLIPFILYKALFGHVFPENILDIWTKLLTDRDFRVPPSTRKTHKNSPVTVRYNTGQPMGALTSWASMALVHHALVLFAAVRAGVVHPSNVLTFEDYMVLGDDVVIAHGGVAAEYRIIMKELHVPLSLAKSHISEHGMFNFANQTFVDNTNVSPASMREEINAVSMAERIELMLRLVRRGWKDINSRFWVNAAMRLLLPQRVWALLTPEIRNGKVPLVIRWILAVLLTPGSTRYGWAGYSNITLETFLAAQLRKGDLFSMSIESMGSLIDRHRSGSILVSILCKWSSKVYAQFLSSRKSLKEDFRFWVTRCISVDLEWLFLSIFETSVSAAIVRWTAKYRMPLKEITVATKMSNFTIDDVEAGTGREWGSLVGFVADSEASLPLVPDFKSQQLDALGQVEVPGDGTVRGSDFEIQMLIKRDRQARESLLRVTSLLGMIDHLGPSGTPGFVEAWDVSETPSQNIDSEDQTSDAKK